MGLVINTNFPALNSSNNIKKGSKDIKKSMEKLASGFKINSAADDASGLAISEKMRNQITALDTYEPNTEDGVNLVQTADGAMAEIGDMLQRGGELAMKASNGVLDDIEREILQHEIDELLDEIDRISVTSNFNGMPIFRPETCIKTVMELVPQYSPPTISGALPNWISVDLNSQNQGILGNKYTDASGIDHCAVILDFSDFGKYNSVNTDRANAVGNGFHTTCCTCNEHYSIEFTNDPVSTEIQSGQHHIYKISLAKANNADDIYNEIINQTGGNPNNHYTHIVKENGKLIIYDERDSNSVTPNKAMDEGVFGGGVAYAGPPLPPKEEPKEILVKKERNIYINSGESRHGDIDITLPDVSCDDLNISDVDITTIEGAENAVKTFRDAINILSSERGRMGAYQNRMEHAINTIVTTSENLTAAKSRIKDTDMAKEMSTLTSHNIIEQTAQAMLAQANSQPQSVLSLLQQ